ncbi:hypothetical protein MAR_022011, partial [Mya arenaria]
MSEVHLANNPTMSAVTFPCVVHCVILMMPSVIKQCDHRSEDGGYMFTLIATIIEAARWHGDCPLQMLFTSGKDDELI